jgi:voltage-gated potassium channel
VPKSFRFRVAYCLASLVLLVVAWPFLEDFRGGTLIHVALMTMVLLSAVVAVGDRGIRLTLALLLVVPALFARWASYFRPDLVPTWVFDGIGMLFLGFVVAQLFRFIFLAPRVDFEVLCAGIAIYLIVGLFWTLAYGLVDRLIPNSFVFTSGPTADRSMDGFQGLYFSFVTLSTVGYGDIVPVSKVTRMLAMVEAVFGMFYVSLLIARLVSLYSSNQVRNGAHREDRDGENKGPRRS